MRKEEFHALLQSVSAFEQSIDGLISMVKVGTDRASSALFEQELERIRSAGSAAVLRSMRSVWALTISLAQSEMKRLEEESAPNWQQEVDALQRLVLLMVEARR